MVGCAVLVRGLPPVGACCVGVWPPALTGVLCWCVAPLIMGRALLVRGPLMVGRAVLVRGPPHGEGCCRVAWAPSWWGVPWWCLAPHMVGRAVLVRGPPPGGACLLVLLPVFVVGGLVAVAVVLVLGRVGRAGLTSTSVAPPLCPGRDGRADLTSACNAPTRVVVSQVLSVCRLFFLVRPPLSCLCAAAVWVLVVVSALFCPPPPGVLPRVCCRCAAVPPLCFPCLLASEVGRPRAVAAAGRPRTPAGRAFACARSAWPLLRALSVSPGCSGFLLPPFPSWCVLRGFCGPAARFSLCALCLFVAAHLFDLSAIVAAGCCSPLPPSLLGLCFAGIAALPLVVPCARSAFLLLPVRLSFASTWSCPPPPPLACFCFGAFMGRGAWCFAVLRAVLCGPWCGAPCRVVRCFFVLVCGVVPHFAVSGCRVLRSVLLWCVAPRCVTWRACVALPCCGGFCCAFGCAVILRCGVLFALYLAFPSWSAYWCAVLFPLALCCAGLRLVVPCGAGPLCPVFCVWCCASSSRAFARCFLLWRVSGCCVLCFVLCCAVLCCCVLCCALGCPFFARGLAQRRIFVLINVLQHNALDRL